MNDRAHAVTTNDKWTFGEDAAHTRTRNAPAGKHLGMIACLMIAFSGDFVLAETVSRLTPKSLCHLGEVEYFGCELQDSKKVVSVCAADNFSPDRGYVQYRFGVRGNVEYKYPDKLVPPRGKFSLVDVSRLHDGSGSHLKFTHGRYTYVVSNALVPGEIYAAEGGTVVFDGICKGSAYMPFDDAMRRGIERGAEDSVDGLDQHGG